MSASPDCCILIGAACFFGCINAVLRPFAYCQAKVVGCFRRNG